MDRRRFLSNTGLTFMNVAIVSNLINIPAIITDLLTETIEQKLKKACDFRKSATQSNNTSGQRRAVAANSSKLEEANAIYDEIIAMDGEEVRAYDGKRKILLQSKFKELEVLGLFTAPAALYIGNLELKERIAKEYMRLALGNKKYVAQLDATPTQLLSSAKDIFEEISAQKPLNVPYTAQYLKADQKLEMNAESIDARDNPEMKVLKRINRQNYQTRYDGLSSADLKPRLDELLSRPNPEFRNQQIRDVYKIYIGKLQREGKMDEAIDVLTALYDFDATDSHTLGLLRTACQRSQRFQLLEQIERTNDAQKNHFWSKIALFDVLLKKYNAGQSANIQEMRTLIDNAEGKANRSSHRFEVKSRRVKLSLAQNDLVQSHDQLVALANNIIGITSSHWIDRFNFLCVTYFQAKDEKAKAIMIYNLALQENDLPLNDLLLKRAAAVNSHRKMNMVIHNDSIRYFRNRLAK